MGEQLKIDRTAAGSQYVIPGAERRGRRSGRSSPSRPQLSLEGDQYVLPRRRASATASCWRAASRATGGRENAAVPPRATASAAATKEPQQASLLHLLRLLQLQERASSPQYLPHEIHKVTGQLTRRAERYKRSHYSGHACDKRDVKVAKLVR